jgi:histidyl-tRNA synthetase|tara:strand:- start:5092 stop:6465 length:1374 start_codon:yes stop_codon:yes gene_type:complete
MQKPILPKGTRDFNSEELYKRNYIINIIKDNFLRFGFNPIETPSFERSETLLGKYGQEGERLIFKILKSGDFLKDTNVDEIKELKYSDLSPKIVDKALRYDLTVPFARYVVQNQNNITIPFKRYQIQNVWRADRPQKGRFREFLQCDADVIGSKSLMQEIDFISLFDSVFSDLKLSGCQIKINTRKLLIAICDIFDCQDKFTALTNQLDKLDKLDNEVVKTNLIKAGFKQNVVNSIFDVIELSKNFTDNLELLKSYFKSSEIGTEGISDIEYIFKYFSKNNLIKSELIFDIGLARGIDYYTGVIFEVTPPKNISMGSIAGGGRYDDLTEIFGLKNMSGIGISFGLDRLFLIIEELNLFPETPINSVKVLILNFGNDFSYDLIQIANSLRKNNINTEFYPDSVSLKKQLNYANKNMIPYVLFYGEEEKENLYFNLKDMNSGNQQKLSKDQLLKVLVEN